jgi:hypothetical protein
MRILRLYPLALIALALLVNTACGNIAGELHYEEIERVKSPDGVVDAIIVRGNGGATTSYNYSVFIVPSGVAFDEQSPIFDFSRREDLFGTNKRDFQLVWREPRLLEIRYRSIPLISHYRNFWQSLDVQNNQYVVDVRLILVNE